MYSCCGCLYAQSIVVVLVAYHSVLQHPTVYVRSTLTTKHHRLRRFESSEACSAARIKVLALLVGLLSLLAILFGFLLLLAL